MDAVPLALVESLVVGALTVGTAWGVVRASIKSLARDQEKFEVAVNHRLDRLEATTDELNKLMHAEALAARTIAQRVSDISELKSTAVDAKVFAYRMNAQDDMLDELKDRIDSKASRGDIPAVKALPPMRPRAHSRPIDREDR